MSTAARPIQATLGREFLSYRVNRFLHLHLLLMAGIGVLALVAPPEAAARGTAWWVLNGVLYVGSLSALLFGLSSAQAESEEFALLFTQPLRTGAWVAGKCAGLAGVVGPAAVLLVLPTLLFSGFSGLLVLAAGAAAGVTVLLSWVGLALGLWIHDPVRALIGALALWCVALFGVDLVLILAGGSPWVQENPQWWVGAMMLSPLDAYRVTILFVLERAAFAGSDLHPLTLWWVDHPAWWITLCLALWCTGAASWAVAGANRRRTGR